MSVESLGQVTFEVKPEVLIRQANEVTSRLQRMTNRFREMERIVNSTNRYWIGEAGQIHREIYKENAVSVEEMLRRLREYPDDLLKISGNYTATEKQLESLAGGLMGEAIH